MSETRSIEHAKSYYHIRATVVLSVASWLTWRPTLHWSSAALDCLSSVTELFQSLLLVSRTVCLNTSSLHPPWLSSGPVRRLIFSPSLVTPLSLYSALAAMFRFLKGHNRSCYKWTKVRVYDLRIFSNFKFGAFSCTLSRRRIHESIIQPKRS